MTLTKSLLIAALPMMLSARTFTDAPLDAAFLKGVADRTPCIYAPNEKMTFTIQLTGVTNLPPEKLFVSWKRAGDDGKTDNGKVPLSLTEPLVITTSLATPGYVRIAAYVVDEKDERIEKCDTKKFTYDSRFIFFEGGAGVEPEKLVPHPEPKDFDDFWAKRKARLEKVPLKPVMSERTSPNPAVAKHFAVVIPCAGPRPATGWLSVPVKEGRYPAEVRFEGYSSNPEGARQPRSYWGDRIVFCLNPHGYELEREKEYYDEFYAAIRSAGNSFALDKTQNSKVNEAYFNGMTYRVMQAIRFVKTLPEWNGRDLELSGGSMGGLQVLWGAGLDPDVTLARIGLAPWCCDLAGCDVHHREKNPWRVNWTEAMGYFEPINLAKRIPKTCRVQIDDRLGLGDYCCPPSGMTILWNVLTCPKRFLWTQGATHGYFPPEPRQQYVWEKDWKK